MDRTERVELTTCVMVTDSQGRMLVQNRVKTDWTGIFFPGGHVEPGESVVRAAIREVLEETGLTIENPRLCGLKQFPLDDGGRYLVLFFKADRYTGTLRDSEEGPVFWLSREELPSHRLSDGFLETLQVFSSDDLSEFFWSKENGAWKQEIL